MAPAGTRERCRIRPLRAEHFQAWDEFVQRHPHASPFHLIAWKQTIEQTFGYRAVYLAAVGEDGIEGILPLFYVRNPVIGRALISSPFAVYGGILADSPDAARRLYERARRLGQKLSVDYLELRNAWPEQCVGSPNVSRYVTFVTEVATDQESLLAGLPKKTRNTIRKARKQPFALARAVTNVAALDRVHSRNMRRLGTPCFSREYFERLRANFGNMVDIREVRLGRKVVAVSLSFLFRDEMHTYHAAADARYNTLAPNTFLYFEQLLWAGLNGYKLFDFGRSKRDTGTFEFKKHWNTTMRELPYEIVLIRRKERPNFSPTNPRFRLAIRMWKALPLPLARLLSRFVLPLFP